MGRVTRVPASDAASFDAAIAAHAGKVPLLLALFCGAHDQPDGSSWCGDCNDAAPVIEAALAAAAEEIVLVEVALPRAEYKGNPSHWARVHAAVHLKAVPTLYRWGNGKKPVGSLVEDQAKQAALVAELIGGD